VSVIAAFPKRSLQLSSDFDPPLEATDYLVWAIFTGPAAAWLLWLFFSDMRPLFDEYRLHQTGTVATTSEVSNVDRYNGRFLNDIAFDVRYVTQDGRSYKSHVAFSTSAWYLDPVLLPLVVRYDPASPQHVSTSYGASNLVGRTVHAVFWSSLPAGWLVLFAVNSMLQARAAKRLRLKCAAIAAQPSPVPANLLRMESGRYSIDGSRSVKIYYTWKDLTGRTLSDWYTFKRDDGPFWLDTARTKMLGLAGPGGESFLLDAGLGIVELTGHERMRLTAARIEALNLSPAAAAELLNTPIGSIAADAPAPAPAATPEAAAAAATEAAKKNIATGYVFSTSGVLLADAAAASASGHRGVKMLVRFLFISGVVSCVLAVGAGMTHDRKAREQKAITYVPFNLADGIAPPSRYVEMTAQADPTMAIQALTSDSKSGYGYIPLVPPNWHRGDPVAYLLYTEGDHLQDSKPFVIKKTGELVRGDLESYISSEFAKRGIKLGKPPTVLESHHDDLEGYFTALIWFSVYGLTAVISAVGIRHAARSMPTDRGQIV
jgi:hypothetical protein